MTVERKRMQQLHGDEADIIQLAHGEFAITDDTEKVFIGINNNNVELANNDSVEQIDIKIDREVGENPQNLGISNTVWQELEVREYNVRWSGEVGIGNDDTASITSVFSYAKANGISKIIFPQMIYRVDSLLFNDFNNIVIDLKGSTLKGVSDVESILTIFEDNTDLEVTNFILDGDNTFYRGIRILGGNNDLRIHNFNIFNISPKIQQVPRNIDSAAIDLNVGTNHDIQIYNFKVDGVTNNDNGIIGDSIGSSRGILVQVLVSDSTNSNIQIRDFIIENVKSEDGDAIQCIGNTSYGVDMDVQFENFTVDHCSKRGLKLQSCYGVRFNNFKIKHTDRSFNMLAGISALSSGNSFSNFEVNAKAIKGFEFSPYSGNEELTKVSKGRLILDNTTIISGSYVFAIDLLHQDYKTIKNIEFEDIFALSPYIGMIVRTYSRNLKVINANFNSYDTAYSGVNLSHFSTTVLSSDGDSIGHANFEVDNIIADGNPFWAGDANTSIRNGVIGGLLSRNLTINPYASIRFKRSNVQTQLRTFYGDGIPTSGTFLQGDYMFFGVVDSQGYTGAFCKTAGSPGVWVKAGITQITP